MKFNISETFLDQKEDMSENDYFDKILDDMDDKFNNEIIPEIPDNVFKAMTEFASSPKYLKIVSNEENGVDKIFIEATEFMNFCEARNDNVLEAAEAIIEEYQDKMPLLKRSDINIVFPSDSINKNILGGENLGEDIKNDWAMQLFTGCRRYGLRPRITGVNEFSFFGKNKNDPKICRQVAIDTCKIATQFVKKKDRIVGDVVTADVSNISFLKGKSSTCSIVFVHDLTRMKDPEYKKIAIPSISKAADICNKYKKELKNEIQNKLKKYTVTDINGTNDGFDVTFDPDSLKKN